MFRYNSISGRHTERAAKKQGVFENKTIPARCRTNKTTPAAASLVFQRLADVLPLGTVNAISIIYTIAYQAGIP
jgi:hypothetical protein